MGLEFDFSEVEKLAVDLAEAGEQIVEPAKKALNITSLKVKRTAQAKVGGRKHFRQAATAITFDVTTYRGEIESEIGYDKDRGGAAGLGNLVEFGAPGSPNALAPGHELQTSLHDNETDFIKGVTMAIDEVLKSQGL